MDVLGVVTRLAGGGCAGCAVSGNVDGVGSAAKFYRVWGMAMNSRGTLYICDSGNNRIRQISGSGKYEIIKSNKRYKSLLFTL